MKKNKKFRFAISRLERDAAKCREMAKGSRSRGFWWDAQAWDEAALALDIAAGHLANPKGIGL